MNEEKLIQLTKEHMDNVYPNRDYFDRNDALRVAVEFYTLLNLNNDKNIIQQFVEWQNKRYPNNYIPSSRIGNYLLKNK